MQRPTSAVRYSLHTLALLLAALAVGALAGCNQFGAAREPGSSGADTKSSGSAVEQDTTLPVLLSATDIARMRRVPLDTIPVHIEPIDNIVRGPAARIVVTDPKDLPAAWTLVGAHGTPPTVDFGRHAVVLIGTAVHGGTWSVSADSLMATRDRLFVIVHEHTTCALVDIYGRGTLALRIPSAYAWHVTFIERPFDSCSGHGAM